jgi:hypothetical protein
VPRLVEVVLFQPLVAELPIEEPGLLLRLDWHIVLLLVVVVVDILSEDFFGLPEWLP